MDIAEKELTYCVYCAVGQDGRVAEYLKRIGYNGISFQQAKLFYHENRTVSRKVPLLPRYVFFSADGARAPDWYEVLRVPGIQRILQYGDGEYALRAEDLDFIHWMKSMNGMLEVSKVAQVGSRIIVIGGPLKHYEGKIVAVKKHRKMVAIELSQGGHFGKVWCPIEYIEVVDHCTEL